MVVEMSGVCAYVCEWQTERERDELQDRTGQNKEKKGESLEVM